MILIPGASKESRMTVKNSRFISRVCFVESTKEIKSILSQIRQEHSNAAHVVYASILEEEMYGMSDDGEPHGTAGRPTLEVLKGKRISFSLLATIRYFGGTKLGTGGLVQAYAASAQEVLSKLPLIERRMTQTGSITLLYPLFQNIKKAIIEEEGEILDEDFSSDITLTFTLPVENERSLEEKIQNLSSGRLKINWD